MAKFFEQNHNKRLEDDRLSLQADRTIDQDRDRLLQRQLFLDQTTQPIAERLRLCSNKSLAIPEKIFDRPAEKPVQPEHYPTEFRAAVKPVARTIAQQYQRFHCGKVCGFRY